MSAAAILDRSHREVAVAPRETTLDQSHRFCRLGVRLEPLFCPACQSPVYSRRQPCCGVCEAPLPQKMLFSQEERARVDSLLHQEEENHKAWMDRRAL